MWSTFVYETWHELRSTCVRKNEYRSTLFFPFEFTQGRWLLFYVMLSKVSLHQLVLWLWCNAENGKANDDSSRGESKCKNLGTCLTLSWRRPLSYRNQQCTGFYVITASVMKELSRNFNINHYWCNLCCFSSIEIITNRGLMRLNLIELEKQKMLLSKFRRNFCFSEYRMLAVWML